MVNKIPITQPKIGCTYSLSHKLTMLIYHIIALKMTIRAKQRIALNTDHYLDHDK